MSSITLLCGRACMSSRGPPLPNIESGYLRESLLAPQITRNHPKPEIFLEIRRCPEIPQEFPLNSYEAPYKTPTEFHGIPLNFPEISQISPNLPKFHRIRQSREERDSRKSIFFHCLTAKGPAERGHIKNRQKLRVARLHNEVGTKCFFSRHEFSPRKMLRYFPRSF